MRKINRRVLRAIVQSAPSADCFAGCGNQVSNENEVCSSCNAGPGLTV